MKYSYTVSINRFVIRSGFVDVEKEIETQNEFKKLYLMIEHKHIEDLKHGYKFSIRRIELIDED